MKNLTLLILCFTTAFLFQPLQAQDCSNALAVNALNGNAVTATLPHAGSLFWNGSDAGYSTGEGLPGGEVHSIFAGGLWMSGFDGSGVLKQAVSTYGMSSGDTDYWPGPLNDLGEIDNQTCTNWDQHWKVLQADIDNFIIDWSDGGVSVDDIPTSVAGWPATGNPLFSSIYGFELPVNQGGLAPFFDVGGDGIYDPTEGDYPLIKGDQAVFWIFNDAGNVHTESGGEPLNMEIHAMAYAYASTNENINNATFYDFKFIHKGTSSVEDAYFGLWIDADLGCYTDDYFGCDPEKDMAFVYNQDAQDGDPGCSCPGGVNTFCDEIPMMGVRMLKGVTAGRVLNANGELEVPGPNETPDVFVDIGLTALTYYNNGGLTPAPPPGTDDPDTPPEYHNYLSGLWKDGTPMTNTGDGYNIGGGGETTTFAFDGNPSEGDEWSMYTATLPEQDRRMVLSSGPSTIEPGAINTMSFAIFHVKDVAHPCPSTENLDTAAEDIYNIYNQITSVETLNKSLNISLSPNPFSNETLLQLEDTSSQVERLDLYNVSGQLVRSYEEAPGNSIVIERGNLTTGMYFYKLVTDKQQYVSGKLFVQ